MKPIFPFIILFLLVVFVSPIKAQDPFTGQEEQERSTAQYGSFQTFFSRLALWQNHVREKISTLVAESKETRSLRPLAALIFLALAYGIIHAAGPGHGKAVAISYILSHRPSYIKGLALGNMIALFHGAGGIVFVLLVYGILHTGIFKSMTHISLITQIVSYSLIICLGLFLITGAVSEWLKTRRSVSIEHSRSKTGENIAAAFIIGLIPCPGVIMVTFLAVSLGLPGLGILLGVFIALGMAFTISLAVIAGTAGKKILIKSLGSRPARTQRVEQAVRCISGLLVTTLGILLLTSELIT